MILSIGRHCNKLDPKTKLQSMCVFVLWLSPGGIRHFSLHENTGELKDKSWIKLRILRPEIAGTFRVDINISPKGQFTPKAVPQILSMIG